MGKFFNGKVKKDNSLYIKIGCIAGGVLIIIILIALIAAKGNGESSENISISEEIELQINAESIISEDIIVGDYNEEDIVIDDSEVDYSTLGTYKLYVSTKKIERKIIDVTIVDTLPPELELKPKEIAPGEKYTINDFILGCTDNSNEECNYRYYQPDENNTINYEGYTKNGTYEIKIVATDNNGNVSEPLTTSLIIGSQTTTNQCQYGNLEIDVNKYSYPVAVIVGNETTGCALNRDLWDSTTIQNPVSKLYLEDYEKLKTELQPILDTKFPNGAKIVAYPHYIAVLNKELNGLVGYAISVKVYIADANTTESIKSDANLKLSYYINRDKTRNYQINVYNLG